MVSAAAALPSRDPLADFPRIALAMKVFATAAALLASLASQSADAGYVTTSGTNFELDGKPFYIFGTNAYWASEITWVRRLLILRHAGCSV
ncbi:unnamed protein product [Phytophthora fragariaefolia]|uniref:Unnamed protein product n=1 Tax=Phytophthora fragariaefolia TaxID=1490495 RepID=A0A9W7D3S3_9STRA|nr:unnamed protein product [Phytophthora fragariaefolia]